MARTKETKPITLIDGVEYRTWQEQGVSWVEYEIAEPWTVTIGFTAGDSGLEVAELHVFPTRSEAAERSPNPRERERPWGAWNRDADLVPPRGLTSRKLRRMVKIDGAARAALRNVPAPGHHLADAGFVTADRQAVAPVAKSQRDPVTLALVAVLYENALQRGEPLPAFISAELAPRGIKCSPKSVPNLVSAARRAGMLPPAARQGQKSGRATPKARRLLAEAARRA